ncbi:MAG: hypothetical protein PF590_06960 [Candidatus Delongbacteria bacterium]|jgi:hypothetical protein|nr:hypothetical protein [Candidatus Delongbacteria bacterium]
MKMKAVIFLCISLFVVNITTAQDKSEPIVIADSVSKDTIWEGDYIGLNVYPAFGMVGGGILPSTKIFLQYKHNWEKSSLRFSANYINFNSRDKRLDIVHVGDTTVLLRQYNNNIFTLDMRIGYERFMPFDGFTFHYGIGAIGGYHHYGKSYYLYKQSFSDYPIKGINQPYEQNMLGWYRADMFKVGADFTLGVDILLSDNVVVTVQYSPELAYYMFLDSEEDDDANVFDKDIVEDFMDFRGDYIDLILSVKF